MNTELIFSHFELAITPSAPVGWVSELLFSVKLVEDFDEVYDLKKERILGRVWKKKDG